MADLRGSTKADDLYVLIRRMMAQMRTAIPGKIVSFDEATQLASVQPLIQGVSVVDNTTTLVDPPVIEGTPIVIPLSTSSGLSLTVPVADGDEGLIVFADRTIDQWIEFGGVQSPGVGVLESRTHHITDAIFIPGCISSPNAISGYDNDAVTMRNGGKEVFVSVSDDQVDIEAGGGSISVKRSDGSITINGDVTVNGSLSATGEVSGTTVVAGLISLGTHVHTGVQPGTGVTGSPTSPP